MLVLSATQIVLCVISGGIVGFSLGLIGGGGSILAVPLLLYVVGIHDPHLVIGTTAFAVSMNALINLIPHAMAGNVKWSPAWSFAIVGVAGALIGSEIGKAIGGGVLLIVFAVLMFWVAYTMIVENGLPSSMLTRENIHRRLYFYGGGVGMLSGIFGIGGGFLIVPALMHSIRMPILNAIASSLVVVGSLGAATAASYAFSGLVDWHISAYYLIGGMFGGWLGARTATRLGERKRTLNYLFAIIIVIVAIYILIKEGYHVFKF